MKPSYLLLVVFSLLLTLVGCAIDVIPDDHDNEKGVEIIDVAEASKYDTVLCYIIEYDAENAVLSYDELEWICSTDIKRIKELDLDAEYDFPNGFFIYNEDEIISTLKVSDTAKVYLVNLADSDNPFITDMEGLLDRQAEYKAPYSLKFEENVIYVIEEQFIP
jgi:hypothetical protein